MKSIAQQDDVSTSTDSLETVVVKAFNNNGSWKTVAAGVNIITPQQLANGNPNSLVAIMNTLPGIRMEERSPGSYRLSIRGSLLRSPFGVRNIKIYWNDLPFTDGGGNTYLNLIAPTQINQIEIVKGPVASMYGAGTGGLTLLKSKPDFKDSTQQHIHALVTVGSFGLLTQDLNWSLQQKNTFFQISQSHQKSDGYRAQSAMKRDAIQWHGGYKWQQHSLFFSGFYTDLFYQTPGGITLQQMQQNPKSARQATATLPSSEQQKTAVYNQTVFNGLVHDWKLNSSSKWQNAISYNATDFKNPFITNFEKRKEQNFAARTTFTVADQHQKTEWTSGAEWNHNKTAIQNFTNTNGTAGSVIYADDVTATQWFAFSQLKVKINSWIITAGASINQQLYRFQRTSDVVLKPWQTINGKINLTPRIALLKKLNNNLNWYTNIAKGFSPPTLAEIRPSAGIISTDLQAESGWNIETGVKGFLFNKAITADIAVYYFKLKDAIVRRNDNSGAEYFINAGSAKQNGIESALKYDKKWNTNFRSTVWNSFSYQPYRFNAYTQGNNNFSGNALTGVPKEIIVSGLSLYFKKSYIHITHNFTSTIPLNDANTAWADSYHLLQCRIGQTFTFKKWKAEWFVFGDNLLDELYSLGNDINAAGNRYYNPAPTRNIQAGIIFSR